MTEAFVFAGAVVLVAGVIAAVVIAAARRADREAARRRDTDREALARIHGRLTGERRP